MISVVAIRLATTFKTETGGAVQPPAPRRETVSDSSNNIADPISAVPGIDMMYTPPEGKALYLQTVHSATGRTTGKFLPLLAGTGGPHGKKSVLGSPRQNFETCTGRAEDVHPARTEP